MVELIFALVFNYLLQHSGVPLCWVHWVQLLTFLRVKFISSAVFEASYPICASQLAEAIFDEISGPSLPRVDQYVSRIPKMHCMKS